MLNVFGNQSLLRNNTQAFHWAPLVIAYQNNENYFLNNVQCVLGLGVPSTTSIVRRHTICKLKVNDDALLKLKARMAQHENEVSDKIKLHTDCIVCSLIDIQIVSITVSAQKWPLVCADTKAAFLQTGPAEQNVYIVSQKESSHKHSLWVLLKAAYSLVNSSSKLQHQIDLTFLSSRH